MRIFITLTVLAAAAAAFGQAAGPASAVTAGSPDAPVTSSAAATSATSSRASSAAPAPASQGTLLLGDSMMRVGVGPMLKRTLTEDFGADAVTIHAKSATGLARPDVYDWPAQVRKLVSGKRYELAVVFLGSNDCQTLGGKGGGAAFGTSAWDKAYRARMDEVLGLLCGGADQVIWLGLPPMRSPKFNARIQTLNKILESEVKTAPCARFVPTRTALADGKGSFTTYMRIDRHRLKVRDDDGVHITQHGGKLVAETVLAALLK